MHEIVFLTAYLGILGMILIALFTINAGFSGTRLGLCWVMLEERYSEFKGEVRDPYPAIAEKAIGRVSTKMRKEKAIRRP